MNKFSAMADEFEKIGAKKKSKNPYRTSPVVRGLQVGVPAAILLAAISRRPSVLGRANTGLIGGTAVGAAAGGMRALGNKMYD